MLKYKYNKETIGQIQPYPCNIYKSGVLFTCHFTLPSPGVFHCFIDWNNCGPSEVFVSLFRVCPYFFNITGTSFADLVGNLDSCGSLERCNKLKHGESSSCAEVEDFHSIFVIAVEHALHCYYVCLCKVYDINVVTDT